MSRSAPEWQYTVAYAVLALPFVYVAIAGGPYPVPRDQAAKLYVCIGLAVGAGVFVVRRRPRDVLGWIGLIVWGGGAAAAMIHALLE
jgi:hypothetical protein